MIATMKSWGRYRRRPPTLGLLRLFRSEWELLQAIEIGGPVAARSAAPSIRQDLAFLDAILLVTCHQGLYHVTDRGYRLLRSWPVEQTEAGVAFDVTTLAAA